jgi:hypothetical protein
MYSFSSREWYPVLWPTDQIGPFVVPPIWTGEEALFYEANSSRFWSHTPEVNLD